MHRNFYRASLDTDNPHDSLEAALSEFSDDLTDRLTEAGAVDVTINVPESADADALYVVSADTIAEDRLAALAEAVSREHGIALRRQPSPMTPG